MRKGVTVELLNDVPANLIPPIWPNGTKAVVKYACVFSDEVDLKVMDADGQFSGYFDRVKPHEIELAEPLIELNDLEAMTGE